MRGVVQRVRRAEVRAFGEVTGRVDAGLCVLVGVGEDDTRDDATALAEKVCNLRIMNDQAGKMNRSVLETGGGILAVSQFTLHGDARKGRRPSFAHAMAPEAAEPLFDLFCAACRVRGAPVGTGRFGADMLVEILGDGPVTILLDTKRTF
jgi:D-tyrosyl-tRNA(Tyr) deacylase